MRNILFLLIFISAACVKKDEIPEDVYPKSQMANVLIDIHLLEQKLDQLGMEYDSQQLMYNHFEQLIFEKHALDTARYRKSINYYYANVEQLEDIYEEVVDSLAVREKTRNIH